MITMSEMHLSLYFLSLLILTFYVSSSSSFVWDDPVTGLVACRPRQIQVFMDFKSEFDTRRCNHSDNSSGVRCDKLTGEITKLRVHDCLSGTLKSNSSLFKLHHLRSLVLSNNDFTTSSIPSEFGYLNRLEVLELKSSGFRGQVPSSFNNLSMLSYLDLESNDLTGIFFPHVWNLTKLSVLSLADNHFSGSLNTNSGLFKLHRLRFLSLGFNNFISPLPSEIGNLNRLEVFSLLRSGFFGQVPLTICNLTRLTELILAKNEFRGGFPLVQNLTKLSHLELSENSFFGTIPSSLFTMPSLSFLNIRGNHLTGSFEVLNSSTSSSLESLYLGSNDFDAKILEPISNLTNLIDLDLSFLNTSYPVDLGLFASFKSLIYLVLAGNNICPTNLSLDAYLPLTLHRLVLSECGLSEFPMIVKTLQNLEFLELSDNLIKGKIPEWLWSLPRLRAVDINGNSFDGFEGLTEVLVNSSVLALYMESNKFQGALPVLPLSIEAISVASNNFTGEISFSICNRSSLYDLNLRNNSFTGPIPQCLRNFRTVNLRMNKLEGNIPDVFHAGASLKSFDVGYNRITGKLPRSLLNCSSLNFLSVDNNYIEDTFPFFLKALPNLQVLILSSNRLYGPISLPHEGPLGFPNLRIFVIADNKFTGSLSATYFVDWKASPSKINEDGGLYMGHMAYRRNSYDINYQYYITVDLQYKGLHMEQMLVFDFYSTIDFSGNLLEGSIPESVGLLKALIALNLSNNAFTGHIPLSLANLKELESLDMSRNQLSGTIPNGLGSLSFLAVINVSHNQLKGEIPQGTQITGQAKSSFEGNVGLCGLPLETSCFETSAPLQQHHEQEEQEEEDEVLNWKGVTIGYGLGVLFGLVIAQVIASHKPEWLAKIIGLL